MKDLKKLTLPKGGTGIFTIPSVNDFVLLNKVTITDSNAKAKEVIDDILCNNRSLEVRTLKNGERVNIFQIVLAMLVHPTRPNLNSVLEFNEALRIPAVHDGMQSKPVCDEIQICSNLEFDEVHLIFESTPGVKYALK